MCSGCAGPAAALTPASGVELRIVTVNVDGLSTYPATSQERMREILIVALDQNPNMLLLQEVTAEMFEVAQEILKGWTVRRRSQKKDRRLFPRGCSGSRPR